MRRPELASHKRATCVRNFFRRASPPALGRDLLGSRALQPLLAPPLALDVREIGHEAYVGVVGRNYNAAPWDAPLRESRHAVVVHAGSAPPRSAEASAATPSSPIWLSPSSSVFKLGIAPSSSSAARAAAARSPATIAPSAPANLPAVIVPASVSRTVATPSARHRQP